MDHPTNSAYGRYDKPPEHEKALTILGYTIPNQFRWVLVAGAAVVILFVLWSVFLTLPSGFPFLAAKFAGGFFSYIGLFFAYMIGFFTLLTLIGVTLIVGGSVLASQNAQKSKAT
jgi:uncharacterized membrane protein